VLLPVTLLNQRPAGGPVPAGTHQNGGLLFGTAGESDEGDAGVQSIRSAVVVVTPGDYFEFIARQTSGSTKNVAADELTLVCH
jgi:hypothetical protein